MLEGTVINIIIKLNNFEEESREPMLTLEDLAEGSRPRGTRARAWPPKPVYVRRERGG